MYTWKQYGGCYKNKTWAVYAPNGELVCVCLYKKGAIALAARLNAMGGGTP